VQPEILAAAAEPKPFGVVSAFLCLSEDTEYRTMLDSSFAHCSLEDERVITREQK
jgi:hypothetical protein